jgi:hypothetical protein
MEIEEVVNTIHDNISQHRSDLIICLPELRGVLLGLMQEHFNDIKDVASKLGGDHPMISMLEQKTN